MKVKQYTLIGVILFLTSNIQAQNVKKVTTPKVKNVLGFTPTKVNKINGLALGISFKNSLSSVAAHKRDLVINGLNLGINPLGFYSWPFAEEFHPYEHDIEYYDKVLAGASKSRVNGMSVSIFHASATKIQGLNIAASVTSVDEINGVSISGLNNLAYKLRGVSIAIVKNKVVKAHGIQIGLYNKATDLRGFQFGLWNVNGRRSLPFINWQFSSKKKRRKKKAKK